VLREKEELTTEIEQSRLVDGLAAQENMDLSSKKIVRNRSKLKTVFWPELKTQSDIESAIGLGKATAYALAVLMCVTVVLRLFPISWLLESAVITGIGFGIGRRSRTCAVLALTLFVTEQIIAFATGVHWNPILGTAQVPGSHLFLSLIVAFFFINAVRGTFAFHRLEK
jgi:hypothetical protein